MFWKVAGGTAVVLFVITAGWLLRMKAAQRSSGFVPVPPEKAMEVYLGLRNQALSSSSRARRDSRLESGQMIRGPS
jgi:hypothetical protein